MLGVKPIYHQLTSSINTKCLLFRHNLLRFSNININPFLCDSIHIYNPLHSSIFPKFSVSAAFGAWVPGKVMAAGARCTPWNWGQNASFSSDRKFHSHVTHERGLEWSQDEPQLENSCVIRLKAQRKRRYKTAPFFTDRRHWRTPSAKTPNTSCVDWLF